MRYILLALVSALMFAGAGVPVSANVNNFTVTNYDIDYVLNRDDEGRSVLKTVETITAEFPQTDQNRGIERAIPKSYDGHPVELKVQSVVNQDGQQWRYETSSQSGHTVVRIGDPGQYVHGTQVFVLTYTQRDVTKLFASEGLQEFYWDTNGTDWKVPIQKLDVSLRVSDEVKDSLTDRMSCYQGSFGSTDRCDLTREDGVYTTSVTDLGRGENVTLAVGFAADTFAPYKQSLVEKIVEIWMKVQGVLMLVSVVLMLFLIGRYSSWAQRKKDVGTVVPEYLPPQDSSIALSAAVIQRPVSFAAQLIDLAVRHYVKIYEVKPARFLRAAVYEFEIVKPVTSLRDEEQEFVRDVFQSTQPGTKISTDDLRKDYKLSTRLMDNPKKLKDLKRTTYGIREKSKEKSDWFKKFSIVMFVVAVVLLSPPLLVVALMAIAFSVTLWVRTDNGVALYRYLQGLKMYISVAEKDRLAMLQSPEGAIKVQVDSNDPKQLVKLYERVLPYAILFGQEKKWNRQLGDYYQSANAQPDWYSGANLSAFNAAAFTSAMSSLTTSIDSTGASYSSSSGSGGGGSSGGGGGGGGGGGW